MSIPHPFFPALRFFEQFPFRHSLRRSARFLCPPSESLRQLHPNFVISLEIQNALSYGKAIVALESTVITHGLPHPTNLKVATRLEEIIREEGAVPATIALLDGNIRIGLCRDELKRISKPESNAIKVSRRDLVSCLVEKRVGGTTVAATMWIAQKAGIRIFATGGIGGVHRGGENTMDVSADLTEHRTNFGILGDSVDSLEKAIDILLLSTRMGLSNGTLIACPLPEGQRMAREKDLIEKATELALKERIRQTTGSAAMGLNIALLKNNARIAARLALLYSKKMSTEKSFPVEINEQNCYDNDKLKSRPKIVCVGASVVDVTVFPDQCALSASGGAYIPSRIIQTAGGVARNHADALSRLGCKVTLISALGTEPWKKGEKKGPQNCKMDLLGRFLMEKCENIDWSHVFHCPNTPTASSVGICTTKGTIISQGFISVDPIMEQMEEDYIQSMEDQISKADFILVDANLNVRTLRKVVELARIKGTKVWFEPTNWTKVTKLFKALGKNALHKVNVISPNLDELVELAKQLNEEDSQKFVHQFKDFLISLSSSSTPSADISEWISRKQIPSALFPPSMSHLLITCDSMGVLLLSHAESSSVFAHHFVPPPDVRADQIVSVSGAGDCFNSGFLSALLNGCDLTNSAKVAYKCAAISLCSAEAVPEAIGQWEN
uniref:Carbohydrate kinase PfkB domain-containing protein n=1 Tax=Globodera rostochiensis TaxID=31243 RepID=A0A914HFY9_GLORO